MPVCPENIVRNDILVGKNRSVQTNFVHHSPYFCSSKAVPNGHFETKNMNVSKRQQPISRTREGVAPREFRTYQTLPLIFRGRLENLPASYKRVPKILSFVTFCLVLAYLGPVL